MELHAVLPLELKSSAKLGFARLDLLCFLQARDGARIHVLITETMFPARSVPRARRLWPAKRFSDLYRCHTGIRRVCAARTSPQTKMHCLQADKHEAAALHPANQEKCSSKIFSFMPAASSNSLIVLSLPWWELRLEVLGALVPHVSVAVAKQYVTSLFLEPVSPLPVGVQSDCGAWSAFFEPWCPPLPRSTL